MSMMDNTPIVTQPWCNEEEWESMKHPVKTHAQRLARIKELRKELRGLEKECEHKVDKDGKCLGCGQGFGWPCPDSLDGVCHYYTEDGMIHLIDGREVPSPTKVKDRRYESDDQCVFCGEPSERK